MIRIALTTALVLFSSASFGAVTLNLECDLASEHEVISSDNDLTRLAEAKIYFDATTEQYVLEAEVAGSTGAPLKYWLTQFHYNNEFIAGRAEHDDSWIDLEVKPNKQFVGTIVLEQDFSYSAVCTGEFDPGYF